MCGISGFVSKRKIEEKALFKTLAHRGPDDHGSYSEEVNDKFLCLIHNRLSIVDLSKAGHQPMWNQNSSIGLIFNGEIYNYKALRAKYLKDYDFKSNTDSEVVLYLYEKMGIEFVKYLEGDFAICLYDKRSNNLLLIRDRLGVKPLYYFKDNSTFSFASELKFFFALGLNPELDADRLNSYFVFKYLPQNTTLLKNVFKVEPGTILNYNIAESSSNITRYWELERNSNYAGIKFDDAKQQLREKIGTAVNSQLMADVPIGNFLSGGIDSSIIASHLRGHSEIKHFTATKNLTDLKEEGSSSDYYYADRLSKEWQFDLHPIPIGSDEANLEMLQKIMYFSDDLIADGSQIPTFLISKAARENVTILLSGMGADEIFLGYGGHQLSYVTQYFDLSPKFLTDYFCRVFSGFNPGKGSFKPYKRLLKKFADNYSYADGNMKYGFFNIVGDFQTSAGIYEGGLEETLSVFSSYFQNGNDVFDNINRFERENFLVKNLNYVDKMTMANSIEARVPFLDRDLVEFAYSLPLDYKLNKFGRTKHILKESYKGILPDYIINRRKAGFGMPLRSILKKDENLNKLLDIDFFSNFGGFNMANIVNSINNHLNGVQDNSALIFAMISFQVWYKRFFN